MRTRRLQVPSPRKPICTDPPCGLPCAAPLTGHHRPSTPFSMSELITQAEQRLLRPGGLSADDLDRVFARLTSPSIDAADLYFQHARSESWVLEDGIVKDGNHSIEQGVGVRALSGEKTGFAYSDEIVLPALLDAAGSARAIAHSGANGTGKPLAVATGRALYPAIDPIETLSSEAKIA